MRFEFSKAVSSLSLSEAPVFIQDRVRDFSEVLSFSKFCWDLRYMEGGLMSQRKIQISKVV